MLKLFQVIIWFHRFLFLSSVSHVNYWFLFLWQRMSVDKGLGILWLRTTHVSVYVFIHGLEAAWKLLFFWKMNVHFWGMHLGKSYVFSFAVHVARNVMTLTRESGTQCIVFENIQVHAHIHTRQYTWLHLSMFKKKNRFYFRILDYNCDDWKHQNFCNFMVMFN